RSSPPASSRSSSSSACPPSAPDPPHPTPLHGGLGARSPRAGGGLAGRVPAEIRVVIVARAQSYGCRHEGSSAVDLGGYPADQPAPARVGKPRMLCFEP